MSGFSDDSTSITFFGTFNGKFTISTTEESAKSDPHGVTRINKNGKTVHELHFASFTGLLVKIATEKHEEYGLQFIYQFIANNQLYQLKLSAKSKAAQAINFRLPNLDLEKEFTMSCKLEQDGDKSTTNIFISQGYDENGNPNNIKYFWTKDDPKELPKAEMKEFDGEEKWDFGKQRKYIMQFIANNIIPKLLPINQAMQQVAQEQSSPVPEPEHEDVNNEPEEEEIDDLPF